MGRRSRKRRAASAGAASATKTNRAKSAPKSSGAKSAGAKSKSFADGTAAVTTAPAKSTRVSRAEQRNAEARAKLKPLAPGERPPAVTVAAVVALVLAIGNLIAYVAGLTIDGKRPSLVSITIPTVILLVAGVGMWRAKYWAVLGFQALLGILICYLALFLIRASNLLGFVVPIAIILPSGFLFWKLVKSMARLQMPENPSRRPRP